MNAPEQLRSLLARPGIVVAPGVYDCVSAKVVERAGFEAAFISGAAVTASVLGYPDVGLQTMSEILNQSRNIARSVTIPVLVDVDTGYGNALNVMRTVREFEAAGLAGVFFEDQTSPKRCGHFEGKAVIPTEEMVVKIQAAREARRDPNFVIIARTDSRAMHGLDHAIDRGTAYAEAGADLVYVESMLSIEEMERAAASIPAPMHVNMSEGGKSPLPSIRDLERMGYKLVSYSGLTQRTAIRAMSDNLGVLAQEGTSSSLYPSKLCNLQERSQLLGLADFYALEERLYGPILDTEGSWRKELVETSGADVQAEATKLPI